MSILPPDPDSKPDPHDPEEFCDTCFAGMESSEHHEKCVAPLDEPDPEIAAAFFDGALEALDFAWSAIHLMRYADEEPGFSGPGDWYHGVVRSRIEVDKLRREYRAQRDRVVD